MNKVFWKIKRISNDRIPRFNPLIQKQEEPQLSITSNTIAPKESTAQKLSFEWPCLRILYADFSATLNQCNGVDKHHKVGFRLSSILLTGKIQFILKSFVFSD